MAQSRETYHFIHNVFGHFFKDMLDYFSTYLYPRFEYRVVGTYDKAVEYLAKRSQYSRETDQPLLPALVLNPSGEFSPADANAGGKQLWRYPNLAPTMIKRLFNPVYQDDHLIMHAGFIRIKGEFELIMLLNSFYEYCDLRLMMINYFGGLDRIIYPRFFSSFIILPDDFLTYEYQNEYTGTHYNIDWSTANASNQLVRSTARNEVVLPLNIKPQISMVSMADASNRYGGPDKIAEWRLTVTVNYEIEMPNYMILESDYLAENVHLEMRYGSAFSSYTDYQPPVNRQIYGYHWDWGLDETSNSQITYLDADDATCDTQFVGDYVYKTRYFHVVTAADAASDPYLDVSLPEKVSDRLVLIVNSKHGAMNYGDHYVFINNGNTLRIKMDNVNLEAGWILELHFYEDITSSSSSSSSVSSSSSSNSSSSSSSSSSLSSSSSSNSSSSSSTQPVNILFFTPTYGAEILSNIDMELNSIWSGQGPISANQSSEQANSGTYSWKGVTSAPGGTIYQTGFGSFNVANVYTATIWIYGSNIGTLDFRMYDGSNSYRDPIFGFGSNPVNPMSPAASWTRYSFTVNPITNNAAYILVNSVLPVAGGTFYIDDASFKQVIGGIWDTDSGAWYINYDAEIANIDGSQGASKDLKRTGILTPAITYDVTFTVSGRTTGSVTAILGTQTGTTRSSDGTFSESITSNGTDFTFRADATFDGTISVISAYE